MITNQDVFDATNGSIKKWERLAKDPTIPEEGCDDCPLCQLFFWGDCRGCPVSEHAKAECCHYTPYILWNDDHTVANAEKELEFLKMLKAKHFGDWK